MLKTLAIPPSSSSSIPIKHFPPKTSPQSLNFPSFASTSPLYHIHSFAIKQRVSLRQQLNDSPFSLDLQPISNESTFHRIVTQAHDAVILVWMANWCRKCIYLKPQLEKLAAEYYPRLRFYHVDVNTVSHKLIARAGVTKMPTIQLWMNGEKRDEVIGGHNKAHMVINDVRQMIENECTE